MGPLEHEMAKTAVLYGTMTTTTTTMLTLVFDTSNVTYNQWAEGFKQAGEVRTYVQMLFKDFVFIAKGQDVAMHRKNLATTITAFGDRIQTLMFGGPDVHAAPVRPVWDALTALNAEWTAYKTFLEDNMNSNNIATSILLEGATK